MQTPDEEGDVEEDGQELTIDMAACRQFHRKEQVNDSSSVGEELEQTSMSNRSSGTQVETCFSMIRPSN